MKRIMVVGPSGAGKSYFSKLLSEKLNISLYHLDNIFWNEDKTHISREEFDIRLNKIVNEDSWIIDGDYSRTYDVRMNACDTIIFLDYPLEFCLKSVEDRIGKKRDDIPWIEDEFDPEFRKWIINWYKDTHPYLMDLLDKYKNKNIIIFKNRDESKKFLNNL